MPGDGVSASPKALILALNDRFRTTLAGGKILVTKGVHDRGDTFVPLVLEAVRAFASFTPDNDPHGEHDFGSLMVEQTKVYWKIDYYDPSGCFGSENPADPILTLRVLTLFLPEEY